MGRDSRVERIAVFRALPGLGDLLCAVPAFRALRAAHPGAQIALIGLPWARAFVERFDTYLDDLLEFPGFPGLPEQPPRIREIPAFLAERQQRDFDLALQMHGSGLYSNPVALLLGARRTIGYHLPHEYRPEGEFFRYPEGQPEILRCLGLLERVGIPAQGTELEFPISRDDIREFEAIEAARSLRPGEYVCIHPGASAPDKRWPPERFAAVADAFAGAGLKIVLTGGAQEREVVRRVAAAMRSAPLDVSGQTGLGALAVLLRSARLLVCNDTGVSHLAAALRVPSVVVFMAADPARWAPLDHELHQALGRPVGFAGPAAAWVPSVPEVTDASARLLGAGAVHAA